MTTLIADGPERVKRPYFDQGLFPCADCRTDTGNELYMVHDWLWRGISPHRKGFLCIGCLERRLGRELTPRDFMDLPINGPDYPLQRSQRLLDRLGYTVAAEEIAA